MKHVSPAPILGIFAVALIIAACAPKGTSDATDAAKVVPATETGVPEQKSNRRVEVLSHHDTNAVFEGTRKHRCMGRSMLCPDRCGHSGTLAVFKIESYNRYEKKGKYGDPQTDAFAVMLNSTTGENEVPPAVAEKIMKLKPGDKVHLIWEHVYVSDDSGARPERPIRRLESE